MQTFIWLVYLAWTVQGFKYFFNTCISEITGLTGTPALGSNETEWYWDAMRQGYNETGIHGDCPPTELRVEPATRMSWVAAKS